MTWVGLAIYAFLCWMAGLVALRIAYRLGSLVEFTVAMITIGIGGIGFPLLALPTIHPMEDGGRALSIGCGVVGLAMSSFTLYFATWRVHRPTSVLAALVCTAGTFAMTWSWLAIVFTEGFAWPRDRVWVALQGASLWLPYPWAAFELLLNGRRLRRRDDEGDRARGKTYLCYGFSCLALTLAFMPGLALAIQRQGTAYTVELVVFLIFSSSITAIAAAIGFADPLRRALRLRAEADTGPAQFSARR